jgi:hypothetical protein
VGSIPIARSINLDDSVAPSEQSEVIANARATIQCMIDPVLGVILEGVTKGLTRASDESEPQLAACISEIDFPKSGRN